jgi:hypothetical protein
MTQPPKYVYVKRNPINPYTYTDPKDLPYLQWKRVRVSVAYNMCVSKKVGWERAKEQEYQLWCEQMIRLGHKII